ncbi:MAG: FecR domain-containing protein [Magnetococcales bacterium]|nr:FecR domain-containing protein [Magnetococcales bacterium]
MSNKKWWSIMIAALLFGLSPNLQAADAIGHVKVVNGDAKVTRESKAVPVQLGDPVLMNDQFSTGPGGSVGITFNDNTRVSIGPETEFVVDEFVYQPQQNKLSFGSRITKGTMQFVSGTIAKLSPETVKINTPTGTIGVRGTQFLVKVEK